MIDASIPLQVKPMQIQDPLDLASKVAQYRGMQNQNQLVNLALQQKQQESDQTNALNQLYQTATNPDGTVNRSALYSGLASQGMGSRIPGMQKTFADADQATANVQKTTGEISKQDFDLQQNKHKVAIQNLASLLTKPDLSYDDVVANIRQGVADGHIDPKTVDAQLANMPRDPVQLRQHLQQGLLSILSADQQLQAQAPKIDYKDTGGQLTGIQSNPNLPGYGKVASTIAKTQTPDSIASNATTRRGQDMNDARASASTGEDSKMDPLAVRMAAQQYLAGDTSALQNFGRGAQGAANLNAVRLEITRQATDAGLNGADIAAKIAEFGGIKAGQRTAGVRGANIETAASEVNQLAPLALDASSKVARSGFLPFGKAQIMFNSNVNDPDMRQFAMANNALVNAYGQVMSRGGAATVSDKEHARELLSTAYDQPSYAAAVRQLQAETRAAQQGPKQVRRDLSNSVSGRGDSSAPGSGKPSLTDIFGK